MFFFYRLILLWVALALGFSENAFAQAKPQNFDGFSYAIQGAQSGANSAHLENPKAPMLSVQEGIEFQLALDKAISQILKLTVDYEALRTRVQNFDASAGGQESREQAPQIELKELMKSSAKQLAKRDIQLVDLQIHLEALQIQYDREIESRIQVENQLRTLQNDNDNVVTTVAENADKSDFAATQLKDSKALVRRLESELTSSKANVDSLLAEQRKQRQQAIQLGTTQAVTVRRLESELTSAKANIDALLAEQRKQKQQAIPLETTQAVLQNKEPSPFTAANEWVIEGLTFKQGSAGIERQSIQTLGTLATHLKLNPELNIQVNGYTDSIGSASFNLHLSQARADAVADYLIKQGIESNRVYTLGYGESRPLGNNALEQGRLLNRRVAVLFFN